MISELLPDTITLTQNEVLAFGTIVAFLFLVVASVCWHRGEARMLKRMRGEK